MLAGQETQAKAGVRLTWACPRIILSQISYVDEAASTCLLLLSTNRDAFYALSNARNSIVQVGRRVALIDKLQDGRARHIGTPLFF